MDDLKVSGLSRPALPLPTHTTNHQKVKRPRDSWMVPKEAVIELLLDRATFPAAEVDHIRSLKDVHVLQLTPNTTQKQQDEPSQPQPPSQCVQA